MTYCPTDFVTKTASAGTTTYTTVYTTTKPEGGEEVITKTVTDCPKCSANKPKPTTITYTTTYTTTKPDGGEEVVTETVTYCPPDEEVKTTKSVGEKPKESAPPTSEQPPASEKSKSTQTVVKTITKVSSGSTYVETVTSPGATHDVKSVSSKGEHVETTLHTGASNPPVMPVQPSATTIAQVNAANPMSIGTGFVAGLAGVVGALLMI